jgi:Ca2+-binding EF-hand superfamily protein
MWNRSYVTQSDLEDFLPSVKAAEALKVLDMDRDGHVSLEDMRDCVLQVGS